MGLEYAFTFPLKNGLHARPASVLQEIAARYRSQAVLTNQGNERQARLSSVLSLVGSGTRQGDLCLLRIEGPDEIEAMTFLRGFLEGDFLTCDEDLPAPAEDAREALPPRILHRTASLYLTGSRASGGVGQGLCVTMRGLALPDSLPEAAANLGAEWRLFTEARDALKNELMAEVVRAADATERAILKAHLSLLGDPDLAATVHRILGDRECSIGAALAQAAEEIGATMNDTGSAYLAARALDVHDLVSRLVARIYNLPEMQQSVTLAEPSVIVAQELGPSQLLALDRTLLRGLVLAQTGVTSHTVILARALGIPCVTGVSGALAALRPGQTVIVDGQRGVVVPDPDAEVAEYYRRDMERLEAQRRALSGALARPGATADGRRVEIGANVATAEEAELAFAGGAEGIGVFRSEMIFMDREAAPSEDEQFETYRRVARAAGERPALIRLLDIGGDKPLPYLSMPEEANPFLGWRGVRIYPAFKELVVTQIRAILRAAAEGNLKIMIPMVDAPAEIRWVREAAAEAAEALMLEGTTHRWPVEIGTMVETPAAALGLSRLAAEADFFSVGTNDLAQYFFAADRGNGRVAPLLANRAPAFLELLKLAVDQAHAAGKWIGLCGEMGGQARNLPLLAGLGLDEISMSAPAIAQIKSTLGKLKQSDCAAALEAALAADDAAGVEAALDAMPNPAAALPLIDEQVILLDVDAPTKELAIKAIIDRLALAGRADEPEAVEEAIWKREDVYATSVGFGFGIPHCKSPHMLASTIAVARLRQPVQWKLGAEGTPDEDDTKAALVIMLAIREAEHGDTHLRLFAQLARKVMHEDFREGLQTAASPAEALALIKDVLGM